MATVEFFENRILDATYTDIGAPVKVVRRPEGALDTLSDVDLKTGVTGGSVNINTKVATDTIETGDYELHVIDESNAANSQIAAPSPIKFLDANDAAFPSASWNGDNGFLFTASNECYQESSSGLGTTAPRIYSSDASNRGLVGRAESRVPAGGTVPAHALRQTATGNKYRMLKSINANSRPSFWNTFEHGGLMA